MRVRSGRRRLWRLRALWSRNPLLRRPGPAERVTGIAALLLCLGLVFAVPLVGIVTWDAASSRAVQPTEVHTVSATVTTPSGTGAGLGRTTYATTVRWWWDGRWHTGAIPTTTMRPQGSVEQVRVDQRGELVSSLFGTGSAVTFSVLATVMAGLVAAVAAAALIRMRGRWLFRRRALAWEREWEQVQPFWTGRS